MENKLEIFKNEEFGQVRLVKINGEPMFVGKDLVERLGYDISGTTSYSKYINQYCDKEDFIKMKNSSLQLFGISDLGRKGGYLVNESGVIKLIQKSESKSSEYKENFKRWLISEKLIEDKFIIKSRKEINFLDKLEQAFKPFGITGKKQYKVLNYKIDYYISQLKIAIEYDENGHSGYTYEQHEGRQKEIEKKLGCKFIRVTDNNPDEYNIGLVFKEMVKHHIIS